MPSIWYSPFTDEDVRGKYTLYPKDQNGKTRNLMGKYKHDRKPGHPAPTTHQPYAYAGAYFIAAEGDTHAVTTNRWHASASTITCSWFLPILSQKA